MDLHLKFKIVAQSNIRKIVKTQENRNYTRINNRSERKVEQETFFSSPILSSKQLEQINKLKSQSKNDFIGQLNSSDPYQFQTYQPQRLTQAKLSLPFLHEVQQKNLNPLRYSDNLQLRKSRERLHRGIPLKHDVQSLAAWVDESIRSVQQKSLNQESMFEEIINILSLCLKELIRQISIDCVEKSVLLEKIWIQYSDITQNIIQSILEERKENEKESLMQIKRTHQLYQTQIDNYEIMLKKERDDLELISARFSKLKDNSKYLKKINRNLNRETKLLKYDLTDLKNTKQYLTLENERLKSYIEEQSKELSLQHTQFQSLLHQQYVIQQNQIQKLIKKSKLVRSDTIQNDYQPEQKLSIKRATSMQESSESEEDIKEQQKKRALNETISEGEEESVEYMLSNKYTQTNDIVEILELMKDGETQTINQQIVQQNYIRPENRYQLTQTNISYFHTQEMFSQTQTSSEELKYILQDEEDIENLIQQISSLQALLNDEDLGTQQDRKDLLMRSVSYVQDQLTTNIKRQRDVRTSLILEKNNVMDDNRKKDVQIMQLSNQNNNLHQDLQIASQELVELESQVHVYDQLNQRIEKRYEKLKNRKENLIEKTQNLAIALQKTYQFKDIMKKKLLEKKQKREKDLSSYNIQITPLQEPSSSIQGSPIILITDIVSNGSLKSRSVEHSRQGSPRESYQGSIKSKESDDSFKSQYVDDREISQFNNSSRNLDSAKSARVTGQRKTERQLDKKKQNNNKQNQNYQLIPGYKQSSRNRKTETNVKEQQSQNSKQNLDQISFIKDAIQSLLSQSKVESDTDSSCSSVITKYNNQIKEIRRKKQTTTPLGPKLNKRSFDQQNPTMINGQRSQVLITQMVEKFKSNPKSIVAKMQKLNVLKLIAQFYIEKIKQVQMKQSPLHLFCYEYYYNTYGFKSMAEKKLINFYQSIITFRDNKRIGLFGRFLQLYEPLTNDDLELYFKGLKSIDDNYETQLINQVNEKGIYISLEKALLTLDTTHSVIQHESKQEIIKDFKQKSQEIKKILHIDVDYYMTKIIEGYQFIRVIHHEHFEEIFYSADMDQDGMIEYQEFQKLYYHLESDSAPNDIHRDFMQNCDVISEDVGQKAMSFSRFVTFNLEQKLFSKQKLQVSLRFIKFRNFQTISNLGIQQKHSKILKRAGNLLDSIFKRGFNNVRINIYYRSLRNLIKHYIILIRNPVYGYHIEQLMKKLSRYTQITCLINQSRVNSQSQMKLIKILMINDIAD
ncbi:hypothetical protein pb186bvf_014773 [Paramecium bursaria]